jgi:hemolysin-activating ACP:hemolysin acyltransferase
MIRKKVAGQSRKINLEDILVNSSINTIVSSKKNRAQDYLNKLKQDKRLYSCNQNENFDRDFVKVVNLSAQSNLHVNYNYLDCVINFAFPLFKNQYALYSVNNITVGYLSWAWFSEQTEKDFYNTEKILPDPDIVNSGSQGWVIDVIAPHGHVKQTVKHASEVARSCGVDPAKFKFQRNYINKLSRRNFWVHR